MIAGKVFENAPHKPDDEQVLELLAAPNIKIERIVSTGQASPRDFWYDLEPGSYVHISAHTRHRVAWTDDKRPTIWLAIHYQ
jgi:cupin 2 domain-containing protein